MKFLQNFVFYFFVISFSESFHILDNYHINKTFSATFTGVVKIAYFHKEFDILGYGTVIKPWAILTSALIPYGRLTRSLVVYTNCKRKTLKTANFVCNYKQVFRVIYQQGMEKSKKIENFYAIFIVPPYRENGRTRPVNLVQKSSIINYNDCFFIRWERPSTARYRYGLLKIPLSISSMKTDKYRIQDDYRKDSFSKMVSRHVLNKFNDILGAPLICRLQNSLNNYVQVGIATINYTAYHLLNETNSNFTVTDGSFVNITAVTKIIMLQTFTATSKEMLNYVLKKTVDGYLKSIISINKTT